MGACNNSLNCCRNQLDSELKITQVNLIGQHQIENHEKTLNSSENEKNTQLLAKESKQNFETTSSTINIHAPHSNFATPIQQFPALPEFVQKIDAKFGKINQQGYYSLQNLPNNFQHHQIESAYLLKNGSIYQGEWNKGQINGFGRMMLPNNAFLRGFFINGQLVGYARYVEEKGNFYQGDTQNYQANGEGMMHHDGVLYKGNFVNNYLQGVGSEQTPQYKFQGEYQKGKKKIGVLKWDLNGQVKQYEGGFLNQQFHGRGILRNQIGQFQGLFQKGKKKGNGIFKWKNGDRFQGIYSNNMKNGPGKMFNSKNIVVLQGNWLDDKFLI